MSREHGHVRSRTASFASQEVDELMTMTRAVAVAVATTASSELVSEPSKAMSPSRCTTRPLPTSRPGKARDGPSAGHRNRDGAQAVDLLPRFIASSRLSTLCLV
jgi:hypothetical protein